MSFCVTKDSNIQKNALQFLSYIDPTNEQSRLNETNGRILSNSKYSWLVNGSKLVVCSCKNGARVGSWDFQNTLEDSTCEILDVDEIQRSNGREPLLAISVNCDSIGGVICIFDFLGSKIIRVINVGEEISSLHVIDSGLDVINLSGPLRNFDGVLAVGTAGANVYILDLYRQLCDEGCGTLRIGEEFKKYQMKIITSEDLHDIENHKQDALQFGSHLAIHLNVVLDKETEHFVLKEPNGTDKVHVDKREVLVSALHYCPQLGSVLVGYNFGAFQLWNLMTMTLTYTSPICEDHIPITKFAIQEPADDPRAYCYVWAVYSIDNSNSGLLPYLVMYALCFDSKEIQESYGMLYENFQYCVVRFHMELGFNHQSVVDIKGGKCLKLESVFQKTSTNSEICVVDGGEEVLSICIVLWRAVSENGPQTFMSVFDLNQWYKEQMPNSPNADDCGNYMITLCATDLTSTVLDQLEVLDMVIQKKKLHQFVGVQKLEEHYYPSSLSFDVCCLLENRIVSIQYQGVQRALLYQIQSSGPLCLIRPTEIYEEIFSLGLMPLFVEISQHLPISLTIQREIILNVALEQQMTDWLCKCASEWANGSFSSAGCSLELLISWAFQRGIVLKNNCDNICESLFDHSQIRLDGNTTNILNNCIRQIKNISLLYTFILKNFANFLPDNDLLLERCQSLHMVEVYFDVLQWLFNVGLLPEYAPNSAISIGDEDKIRAPFPADELVEYYRNRRVELQLKQKRHFPMNSSVLFIDNLIEIECGGNQLSMEWKKDGGDGFYPPRSLQALLRTYLKDGIEVCNKHAVVIYLFLDLAMILDPEKYSSVTTHLIKFPAVFKVSPSLIKITQAFWQLDHGDFSTAMEQLLDPLVNSEDLKYWHHKLALKSLLVQDQPNAALLYMNVKKPPILVDEDVLCALSLFISNNMLDEAFYMEKHFSNHLNSEKLIRHLLAECSYHGQLANLISRNLTNEEETLFLKFLDEVQHPEAADLKVAYFMQRNHYIEAFKIYSKDQDPLNKGLVGRLTAKTRDQIVHNYKKILPTVTYKFIESCSKEPNPKVWNEILVNRANPVSVIIHKTKAYPESKSSIPFTFMAKAKQITHGELKSSFLLHSKTEETPFLRTPTVMASRKRPLVQVITSRIVEQDDKYGPSPRKRPRLSPNSISHSIRVNNDSSILETPIIQRKERSQILAQGGISKDLNSTPSILKNSSFLSKRANISRSNVRFEIPKSPVSSPETTKSLNESVEGAEVVISPTSSKSLSQVIDPLMPTNTSDPEVFYSPNQSLDDDELKTDNKPDENEICEKMEISYEADVIGDEAENSAESSRRESITTTPRTSPQRRRSYKNLLNEPSLLKSSPRLDTTKLTSSRKSNSEKKFEGTDSPRVQPRKPLHLNWENDSFSKSVSGESLRTSVFHTENKTITTVGNEEDTEVSFDKTEFSDIYCMESPTPEKFSERHSVIKTASSFRETTVDHIPESMPLVDADEESESTLLSDSFMEYLVDDLRQRQSRFLKEEKDQIKNENSIETEPAPVIRRSRRLSAERSLPNIETTMNESIETPLVSLSSRTTRKSSEERSLTEPKPSTSRTRGSSVDKTIAVESPAKRTSRRLLIERNISLEETIKANSKAPILCLYSRTARKSSEERSQPEPKASTSRIRGSSADKTIAIKRTSRRLSAERSLPGDETRKKDSSEIPLLSIPSRTTRKSSEERSLPETKASTSKTRGSSVDKTISVETSAKRSSRRLSAERSLPGDETRKKDSSEIPLLSIPSRTTRKSSEERSLPEPKASASKIKESSVDKTIIVETPGKKTSSRFSAERSFPGDETTEEDSSETLSISRPSRTTRKSSEERSLPEQNASTSSIRESSVDKTIAVETPDGKISDETTETDSDKTMETDSDEITETDSSETPLERSLSEETNPTPGSIAFLEDRTIFPAQTYPKSILKRNGKFSGNWRFPTSDSGGNKVDVLNLSPPRNEAEPVPQCSSTPDKLHVGLPKPKIPIPIAGSSRIYPKSPFKFRRNPKFHKKTNRRSLTRQVLENNTMVRIAAAANITNEQLDLLTKNISVVKFLQEGSKIIVSKGAGDARITAPSESEQAKLSESLLDMLNTFSNSAKQTMVSPVKNKYKTSEKPSVSAPEPSNDSTVQESADNKPSTGSSVAEGIEPSMGSQTEVDDCTKVPIDKTNSEISEDVKLNKNRIEEDLGVIDIKANKPILLNTSGEVCFNKRRIFSKSIKVADWTKGTIDKTNSEISKDVKLNKNRIEEDLGVIDIKAKEAILLNTSGEVFFNKRRIFSESIIEVADLHRTTWSLYRDSSLNTGIYLEEEDLVEFPSKPTVVPAIQIAAPTTAARTTTTPARAIPTAAPTITTAVLSIPTAAPATPTSAPARQIAAPTTSTVVPITPRVAPTTPTVVSTTPTSALATPTAVPITPTVASTTPTAAPATRTTLPTTPTAATVTLSAPATPTEAPATPTAAPATPSVFERNIIIDPDVIVLDESVDSGIEKVEVIELNSSSETDDVQSISSTRTTHSSSSSNSSASSKTTIIMNNKSVKKTDELSKIEETEEEDEDKSEAERESKKTEVNQESGGNSDEQIAPARRLTRRSSRLSDSGNDVQKATPDSVPGKSQKTRLSVDPSSPSQVNVSVNLPEIPRTTSVSKPKKTYSRKRTRSCDTVSLDENAGASTSRAAPAVAARRNLRSASVEPTTSTVDTTKSSVRSTSKTSQSDEGSSSEKKSKRKPVKVEKKTAIATYALTRRLTRRQANLLEKTITEVDEEMVEVSNELLSSVEQQDRIELLDKPSFEGVPDPDEQKIYDTSPTSSTKSDTNSNSGRRTRRSSASSQSSESSNVLPESPKSKGSRRRLRSASIEKEDVIKRTKQMDDLQKKSGKSESSSAASTRRTRSKKNDEKADSDSSSVKSTRSTRSKKSDADGTKSKKVPSKLPEIIEEPSEEEDKPQVSRRKRK